MVWKRIKGLFAGKPRPIYEMKITPEQMKMLVNKNIQIKLGQLQAIIANQKKVIADLRRRLEEVNKEKERKIVMQLNQRCQELSKERREKRVAILFDTEKPIFLRSAIKKQFFKKGKYLRGFEFEDTDYGPRINFVVSPEKKGYKNLRSVRGTLLKQFHRLIYDPQSFVMNLKSSRSIIINVTPDEQFIPFKFKVPIETAETSTDGGGTKENNENKEKDEKINSDIQRMKEIDMKKIEDECPEAALIISNLYSKINSLSAKLQEAEEREQEALNAKIDAESSVRILSKNVDRLKALLHSALEKLDSAYSRLGTAELIEQDMKLKSTLAEALVMRVMSALDRLSEKLESREAKTAVELAKEEIKDDFDYAFNRIMSISIPETKREKKKSNNRR